MQGIATTVREGTQVSKLHMTLYGGVKQELLMRFMANGHWSDSFELLFRWKAEVMKRSLGSVIEIDVVEVDGEIYFHHFFCALKPCIDGFLEGCRPHLSVDATALNDRWNGHLAVAVAVDGHNWMYPVAYGFMASETTDN